MVLHSFILTFFLTSSFISLNAMSGGQTQPPTVSQAQPPAIIGTTEKKVNEGTTAESMFSTKEILDRVRKGVVVLDVKTYASTDAEKKSAWSGSGFIVDIDEKDNTAIIATNRHVAGDLTVSTYNVKFYNGTTTPAQLLYFDPLYDFAFLKVDRTKLPKDAAALELSSKPLEINMTIYTMGNSARDEFSTYKCTVFSLYKILGPFAEQSVEFSGLTIPGASGSPGFDEQGKVVLIVYGGKISSGSGLPISYVKDALDALKQKKTPLRYTIGIVSQYVSLEDIVKAELLPVASMQEYLNAFPDANNKVLMVNSRLAGTDARAWCEAGDILWKVNGTLIGPKLYEFDKIVNNAGYKKIAVDLFRKGKPVTVELQPSPLPQDYAHHMITFADATWVSNNPFIRLFLGEAEEGVYMLGAGQTSPFRSIFGNDIPQFLLDMRIIKVTELDGKPIKTLKSLIDVIPSLMQKRELTVKYIDYMGMVGLGTFAPADRQERLEVITYESKFDSPKYYQYDPQKTEWNTVDISASLKETKATPGMSLYKETK